MQMYHYDVGFHKNGGGLRISVCETNTILSNVLDYCLYIKTFQTEEVK